MDSSHPVGENYANPKTCFFHVLFKAAGLVMYILSALFFDSFVIIFVVTFVLAALDFLVVKNVSCRILGESVWKFECLDQQSSARMNKKDSWLFWWTLYLNAAAWVILGIFSVFPQHSKHCWIHQVPQRFGYFKLSVTAVSIFYAKVKKCSEWSQSYAKKQIQGFACQAIASHFTSTIRSALSAV
ncbi:hypothetical protein BDE02_02G175500 [Populus trichocarpa]|nr:hypothetical protein BDE02_02G175500 [Populus trichocarpa]